VQLNATCWEKAIVKNGLDVRNDGQPTHYWTREDHEGESVINWTLAKGPIMEWFILACDHAPRSDHEVILL
jgi:hypothetical protein